MSSRKPKSSFAACYAGVGGSSQVFQFSEESRAELLAEVADSERGAEFVTAVERTLDDYHLQLSMDREDTQRTNAAFQSLERISSLLEQLGDAVRESEGYGYGFLTQALYNENCRQFFERHPARAANDLERYSSAVKAFQVEHDGRERRRPRNTVDDSFWHQIAYLYQSVLGRYPGTSDKSPFVSMASMIAKHGAVHELVDMRGKLRNVRKRATVEWGKTARG